MALKFAIIGVLIYSLVSDEASALNYGGTAIYSAPTITVGGQVYQSRLAWDHIFNPNDPGRPCTLRFNFNPFPCQNFPYFGTASSDDRLYVTYSDGTFVDEYNSNRYLSIELDFTGVNNTGAYLLAAGGFRNYDQMIKYDFYMSGNMLHYRLFFHGNGLFNIISEWVLTMNDLPLNYSNINWGNTYPRKMILNLEDFLYSRNTLIGADTWIRGVSVHKITDTSNVATITYEGNNDPGRKFLNSFSALSYASGPNTYLGDLLVGPNTNGTAQSYFTDANVRSNFPYIQFNGSDVPIQLLWFPNMKWHTFGNLTSAIENNPSFSGRTQAISDSLGYWYIGQQSNYSNQSGSSNDPIGGGGSGSGSIYYSNCGGVTDFGCYIEGFGNFIYDSISDFFDFLFPEISFSGSFDSCGEYDNSTGSLVQKFANVIAIVNPIPIDDGGTVCTIWGPKTIEYSLLVPEETFFEKYIPGQIPELEISMYMYGEQTLWDLITIFALVTLIFYHRKND